MKKIALITAVLALAATPALASHCPKDAAAIDAALAKVELSESDRQTVTELRDRGMQLHEAGDHDAAEETLAEAMRTLLMGIK